MNTIQLSKLTNILDRNLQAGDVILLFGNMGAGKTYFTQNLCNLLQATPKVSSPTYTITNEYSTHYFSILHTDLYRIKALDEFLLAEIYDPNKVSIIEWSEKIHEYTHLFDNYVEIHLQTSDREQAKIKAYGRFASLLAEIFTENG